MHWVKKLLIGFIIGYLAGYIILQIYTLFF